MNDSEDEFARRYTREGRSVIGPRNLPETEKEKDRDLVRGIPKIVAKAGYAVAKTRAAT